MSSYPPPYQSVPQNSTTAIISLIAGICGLTVFPFLGSVIAVITGHMAKGEIARSGGTIGGSGAATWGLILGYVGIGLSVIGLCLFAALFLLPFLLVLLSGATSSSLLPIVAGLI